MNLRGTFESTWAKLIVVLLPMALMAGAALVRNQVRVSHLEIETTQHVTRQEVNAQLDAILREIAALREDVRDLRRLR